MSYNRIFVNLCKRMRPISVSSQHQVRHPTPSFFFFFFFLFLSSVYTLILFLLFSFLSILFISFSVYMLLLFLLFSLFLSFFFTLDLLSISSSFFFLSSSHSLLSLSTLCGSLLQSRNIKRKIGLR